MNWRLCLLLSALGVIGITAGMTARFLDLRKVDAGLHQVIPAPDSRANRTIYPFSVIPGGVRDNEELRASIVRDPVVAEHYRDIQPARMLPIRLVTDLDAYVSYRSGQKIFWTHHLIRIKKGELLLTDGQSIIRGRCGNQIVPAYLRPNGVPITLDPMAPPPAVFEAGIPPLVQAPISRAIIGEGQQPSTPAVPPIASIPDLIYWPPVAPPISWCCSGTSTSAPGPSPGRNGGPNGTPRPPLDTPSPGGTPTPVPEPASVVLIGMGLVTLRLFHNKARPGIMNMSARVFRRPTRV